jgi:predicted transcriptional regulator
MVEIPLYAQQRGEVIKLIIECARGFAETYFGTTNLGENATEIVIACFIFVGQAEKRPMTAGDISVSVGFPRATVHRYLQDMESRGIIESAVIGRRRVYGLKGVNDPKVFQHLGQVRELFAKMTSRLGEFSAQNGH